MRLAVLALIAVLAAAVAASAHDGATGVVKARMDGMKSMSDATKAIGAMGAGAIPFTAETTRRAAGLILSAARAAKTQFPEGTDGDPSDALPAVWVERARFDALLGDLIAAAEAMDEAAENRDAVFAAAERVGAVCKACHADFRRKTLH